MENAHSSKKKKSKRFYVTKLQSRHNDVAQLLDNTISKSFLQLTHCWIGLLAPPPILD